MWVQCFAIKRCTFFGYAMVWRHCALMGAFYVIDQIFCKFFC